LIDAYIWPTGNGKKISIMLEECGLEYRAIPVNINKGDQFKPEFEALSPNNKMPAIVDHDAQGGPIALFESGRSCSTSAKRPRSCRPTAWQVPSIAVGVLADWRPWPQPGRRITPEIRTGKISTQCTAFGRSRASTR
jgi:hypothetical protein